MTKALASHPLLLRDLLRHGQADWCRNLELDAPADITRMALVSAAGLLTLPLTDGSNGAAT